MRSLPTQLALAYIMAATESAPLILKRGDFRDVSQPDVPDTVACCCVESTRLARVPVIKTLFRKRRPEEKVRYRGSSIIDFKANTANLIPQI